MSHSLGCPYTLVFLNKQTQDWKDRYILQWITLSGKKKNKSDLSFEAHSSCLETFLAVSASDVCIGFALLSFENFLSRFYLSDGKLRPVLRN